MHKLFCYKVTDNSINRAVRYGLCSSRGNAMGAGIRFVRKHVLRGWTVKVKEVCP